MAHQDRYFLLCSSIHSSAYPIGNIENTMLISDIAMRPAAIRVKQGIHVQIFPVNQKVERKKKTDRSLHQHKRCWCKDLPRCSTVLWRGGSPCQECTDQRLQPLAGKAKWILVFQNNYDRSWSFYRILLNRQWYTDTESHMCVLGLGIVILS